MPTAKAIISLKTLQYLCDEVKINRKRNTVTGIAKTFNETPKKSNDKSSDRFRLRKATKKSEKRKKNKLEREDSEGSGREQHKTSPASKQFKWQSGSESKSECIREGSSSNGSISRRPSRITANDRQSSDCQSGSVSSDETNGSDNESVFESE